jgi:hypothetical protein
VTGGDWDAHPSNTATRRILVTYSFLVAVSGEGSPELPGIRMNNFILCPMIIVFRMNNPSSFVHDHWKQKCRFRKLCGLIASLAINGDGAYSTTTGNKIDDLRARSMTCEQKRCVCVCDFAYLVMKIWPHCNLVLMYQ